MKNSRIFRLRDILTVLLVVLMAVLIIIFVNGSFLKNYYINRQLNAMKDAYNKVNEATNIGTVGSDEFDVTFKMIVEKYNMNILVLDTQTETIRASSRDYERLTSTLLGYVFNKSHFAEDVVLENTNKYEIHQVLDAYTNTGYLDLWGILDNGYLFLVRCPVESIIEVTNITGNFFSYIIILIAGFIILTLLLYSRHRVIDELKIKNDELKKDIERKEQLEKMRSEFLSNVSHELKTPIALIQGYAEGLEECINDDEESKDYYLEVIVDEASKMNNIVKKLLDINNLEFGEIKFEYSEFNIVSMINNYIQSSKILTDSKNVNVKVNASDDYLVYSDEYYIEEVFGNYFTNALNHVKYSNNIDIKIEKINNKVYIKVFNTGDPIPEESIPHLFEKFYKVDKARTRQYGGSGVGLSIVKAILDNLNEDYGVNNFQDGVEFYFSVTTKEA